MREFTSRVEAQRQLLKTVNEKPWQREQLLALNSQAIRRWSIANHIDASTRLVHLLNDASAQIFTMANHSDDPIAGDYLLTKSRVDEIQTQIKKTLEEGA